jgi:hypothetical protein
MFKRVAIYFVKSIFEISLNEYYKFWHLRRVTNRKAQLPGFGMQQATPRFIVPFILINLQRSLPTSV